MTTDNSGNGSFSQPGCGDLSNAAIGCEAAGGQNTQTSSYTLLPSDIGKLVVMNCASPCTVTLYGAPANGYYGAISDPRWQQFL